MELEGSISSFDITEIFQFIASSKLTGICNLNLEKKGKVKVYFDNGNIAFLTTNEEPLPLKEILFHQEKLSYNSYKHLLDDHNMDENSINTQALAELVIKNGFVTEKELNSFIRLYLEEEILDLFRFKNGEFKFDNLNTLNPGLFPSLSIEVEPLVIEGNRRSQEWVKFLSEIYSEDLIFANKEVDSTFFYNINLSLNEWKVFSLISGKLSVHSLLQLHNASRYELYRALFNLIKLDLIRPQNLFEFDLYSKRMEKEAYADPSQKPLKPEEIAQQKKQNVKEKGLSFKKLLQLAGFSNNSNEKNTGFPIDKYNIQTSVGVCILFNNLFFGNLAQIPEFIESDDDHLLYINLWKEKIRQYPRIDIVKFGSEGLEWHKYERLRIFIPDNVESFNNTTEDIIHALHEVLSEIYQIGTQKVGEEKVRKIYKELHQDLVNELERLNKKKLNRVPQKVW